LIKKAVTFISQLMYLQNCTVCLLASQCISAFVPFLSVRLYNDQGHWLCLQTDCTQCIKFELHFVRLCYTNYSKVKCQC